MKLLQFNKKYCLRDKKNTKLWAMSGAAYMMSKFYNRYYTNDVYMDGSVNWLFTAAKQNQTQKVVAHGV